MALTFPQTPTLNEVYNYQGLSYVWDGNKWTSRAQSSGVPLLPDENGNVTFTGNLTVNGSNITASSAEVIASSADISGNLNVAGDIDND